jgi:Protein of unknown function (DUF2934)
MTGLPKLDQLLRTTDSQLTRLASDELEIGLRAARQALNGVEDWRVAGGRYQTAKEAYAAAIGLISLVRQRGTDGLGRLKIRLEHLRQMLEALSVIGSTSVPTEHEIAALARALRKARGCPERMPEEDWFRAEQILRSSHRVPG